jgi:hypothetical protein
MIEGELDETLQRPRYGRRAKSSDGENGGVIAVSGHRHGHRTRSLTGTFGTTDIKVPRAPLDWPGRQDRGMEEQGVADLSAPARSPHWIIKGLSPQTPISVPIEHKGFFRRSTNRH